jgi:hypothetical protein
MSPAEHPWHGQKAVRGVGVDPRSNLTNGRGRRWRTAVPSATVRRNDELMAGGGYFSVCNGVGTVGIAGEVGTLSRPWRVWPLFLRNVAE